MVKQREQLAAGLEVGTPQVVRGGDTRSEAVMTRRHHVQSYVTISLLNGD
jgi:hypothetical protein